MLELIIIIVVFLLLLLFVVWGHFLRQQHAADIVNNSQRDETNVRLYHEHKAEIEKDFQQASIDKEDYHYLLEELDKGLLQDIEENKLATNEDVVKAKPLAILWPVSITLFVLVFSFALYSQNGAYEVLAQPQYVEQKQQPADEVQQLTAKIQQLKALIEKEPNNADAWYSLGQTLVGAGDFDNAIHAFDQVIGIEGVKADLLGAKAQANYYKNNQKIDAVVQALIDQALALDPAEPSTNILLGMHSFISHHYEKAISHWQLVIDANKASVNVKALTEAINEAKNRLQLTGTSPKVEPVIQSAQGSDPQLNITVSLNEEITKQLSSGEDKTVFIYAIPANGKRMPLAAIKIKASDLPTTVVLNNSKAMTPQANLSSVDKVHVYAIVSKSGGAGIKSGDFKAELLNVDVNTTVPIELQINTLVP